MLAVLCVLRVSFQYSFNNFSSSCIWRYSFQYTQFVCWIWMLFLPLFVCSFSGCLFFFILQIFVDVFWLDTQKKDNKQAFVISISGFFLRLFRCSRGHDHNRSYITPFYSFAGKICVIFLCIAFYNDAYYIGKKKSFHHAAKVHCGFCIRLNEWQSREGGSENKSLNI